MVGRPYRAGMKCDLDENGLERLEWLVALTGLVDRVRDKGNSSEKVESYLAIRKGHGYWWEDY